MTRLGIETLSLGAVLEQAVARESFARDLAAVTRAADGTIPRGELEYCVVDSIKKTCQGMLGLPALPIMYDKKVARIIESELRKHALGRLPLIKDGDLLLEGSNISDADLAIYCILLDKKFSDIYADKRWSKQANAGEIKQAVLRIEARLGRNVVQRLFFTVKQFFLGF